MPAKVSQSVEDSICESYADGMTSRQVAAKVGVAKRTVLAVLRRRGVKVRPQNSGFKLADKRHLVAKLYSENYSIPQIAEKLGTGRTAVSSALTLSGVERRAKTSIYNIDHYAFDVINEYSAYWIGFLLADGCITNNPKGKQDVIGLGLAFQDYGHLKKFKSFVKADNPITVTDKGFTEIKGQSYKQQSVGLFRFSSQRISNRLAEFGVVSCKTYTAYVDSRLKDNRHFWRGLVDGDGCVSRPSVLSLCGTLAIVQEFAKLVYKHTGKQNKVRKSGKHLYELRCNCSTARKMLDWLYTDAGVYLDRKHHKALQIINTGACS